jgi:hypothetical protein
LRDNAVRVAAGVLVALGVPSAAVTALDFGALAHLRVPELV